MSDVEQPKIESDQPKVPTWILGVTTVLAGYMLTSLFW